MYKPTVTSRLSLGNGGSVKASGVSRTDAAAFVSDKTGRRVGQSVLRYWETIGLLDPRGCGRRVPARYEARDLVAAYLVAELRAAGASP